MQIRLGPLGLWPKTIARQQSTGLQRQPVQDTFELRFGGRVQPNVIERQALQFIRQHLPVIHKLVVAANQANWDANTQGFDYSEHGKSNGERVLETAQAYARYTDNPTALAQLKTLLAQKDKMTNRLVVRQLEKLYQLFEGAGKSPEILDKESRLLERTAELTGVYNTYVPLMAGSPLSNNQITERMGQVTDQEELKKLWMARYAHGLLPVGEGQNLAQAVAALVKDRNAYARESGKPDTNYFSWMLEKSGVDEQQLVQLIDQLEQVNRKPFEQYLTLRDALIRERYGVSDDMVRLPWLASGGNEAFKRLIQFDMEPCLQGKNPVALVEKTVNLMGDSLKPVWDKSVYWKNGVQRSSLYFDPEQDQGKSQQWLCFGNDPPADVRVLGAADPNHRLQLWATVKSLLHEGAAHGLDYALLSPKLPVVLRGHHDITMESRAMLFEDLVYRQEWLEKVLELPQEQAKALAAKGHIVRNAEKLYDLRWMMGLIDFERQLYQNPEQDATALWWQIQNKYLGTKRPDDTRVPAFASVLHFISHPVYTPNYFLAELVRAQLQQVLDKQYGGLLNPKAGDFLRTYRAKGDVYDWTDLVERMTGKPLGVEAVCQELSNLDWPVLTVGKPLSGVK